MTPQPTRVLWSSKSPLESLLFPGEGQLKCELTSIEVIIIMSYLTFYIEQMITDIYTSGDFYEDL